MQSTESLIKRSNWIKTQVGHRHKPVGQPGLQTQERHLLVGLSDRPEFPEGMEREREREIDLPSRECRWPCHAESTNRALP